MAYFYKKEMQSDFFGFVQQLSLSGRMSDLNITCESCFYNYCAFEFTNILEIDFTAS